jgi:hypothetical protein
MQSAVQICMIDHDPTRLPLLWMFSSVLSQSARRTSELKRQQGVLFGRKGTHQNPDINDFSAFAIAEQRATAASAATGEFVEAAVAYLNDDVKEVGPQIEVCNFPQALSCCSPWYAYMHNRSMRLSA